MRNTSHGSVFAMSGRPLRLAAATALVALVDTSLARAAEGPRDFQATPGEAAASEALVMVRRRRRQAVSSEMDGLGRAQGEEFLALAAGAAVGILGALLLSVVWRRLPTLGRALAGVGLASATTSVVGLWLVTGRMNPAIVGSGIAWLLLAATLVWLFRPPPTAERKESLAWLRVPSSPGRREAGSEGRNGRRRARRDVGASRPAADGTLLEAEAETDRALAALERGEAETALAGLRRSIKLRPTKRAHTFLGTVLGARGEREHAIEELDKALELDAGYGEALDEKARILEELGRTEEAEALRKKSSAPAPRSAGAGPHRLDVRPAGAGPHRLDVRPAGAGPQGPKVTRRPDLSRLRKRSARPTAASGGWSIAPWKPAAAFSAAVVAGALLSLVYAAGREYVAARGVIAVLEDAEAGLSSSGEADALPVRQLEGRRLDVVRANPFTRDRAASLKAALALHAYGRARELRMLEKTRGEDPDLSRWAAAWARRRIAEARAALLAGDRTRLPTGLAKAFSSQREDFEYEIERRRRRARSPGKRERAASLPSAPGERPESDWRAIWKRPSAGTTFMLEAFSRTSPAARGERAAVGHHRDGSPVAAVGLLRCTVAPPPRPEQATEDSPRAVEARGDEAGPFVLLVESVAYAVEATGQPPGGMPPEVRLVPREGKKAAGRFRVEFGPRLEFRSLVSLAEEKETGPPREELLVSDADLYARSEIPFKSLPIFAPGLSPSWEEDVSYFRPYPPGGAASSAQAGGAPSVKQVTHWKMAEGDTRMRIGWRMRYVRGTREYTEQVVQAWTVSRAWWDFYDDGVLFFRTVFPPPSAEAADGQGARGSPAFAAEAAASAGQAGEGGPPEEGTPREGEER